MKNFLENNPSINDVKKKLNSHEKEIKLLSAWLREHDIQSKWRYSLIHGKVISYYALKNDESVYVWFKYKGKDYKKKIGLKKRDKITEKKALVALKKWEAKVKGQVLTGQEAPDKLTFGQLWEDYTLYAKRLVSYPNMLLQYEKHFKEDLENRIVMSIDYKTILYYQDILCEDIKDSTINSVVGMLMRVLKFGVENGLIDYMPVRKYTPLFLKSKYDIFLNDNQVQQLKESVKDDEDLRVFVALALGLGARTNAILNITGKDVLGHEVKLWDGKTKTEYKVDIDFACNSDEEVKKILRDAPKDYKKLVGGSTTAISREKMYYRLMKHINILFNVDVPKEDRVRLHTLRHTFATLHLRRGVGIYEVKKLLNHSSVKTTERYLHF